MLDTGTTVSRVRTDSSRPPDRRTRSIPHPSRGAATANIFWLLRSLGGSAVVLSTVRGEVHGTVVSVTTSSVWLEIEDDPCRIVSLDDVRAAGPA